MSAIYADDDRPIAYSFTVQFLTEQDFSFNLTKTQMMSGNKNLTFPECRVYNGDGSFTICPGCTPSTYTNFNVTFVCRDIGEICGGGTTSRRLQASTDDMSISGGNFQIQQYGAIIEAASAAVVSILSKNPFDVNIREAAAILSFVGSLIMVIVLVGIYLYRLDEREDEESVAQQTWPPKVDQKAFITNSMPELFGFAAKGLKTNAVSPIIENDDQKSYTISHLSSEFMSKMSFVSGADRASEVENTKKILDTIIPSLFEGHSFLGFVKTVMHNHSYLLMFTHPSYSSPRFIRWIQFCKSTLLALFIDTLFFQVFYGNDGTCETFVTESTCLLPQNAATGDAKCIWTESYSNDVLVTVPTGVCSLRPPPQDFVFQIMLALLTMILAIPIDVGMGFVVDTVCNCTPLWHKIRGFDEGSIVYRIQEIEEEWQETRQKFSGLLHLAIRNQKKSQRARVGFDTYLLWGGCGNVSEELEMLKTQLTKCFQQTQEMMTAGLKLPAAEQEAWFDISQARSEAIERNFGINDQGRVNLSLFKIMRKLFSSALVSKPILKTSAYNETWYYNTMKKLQAIRQEQKSLEHTLDKLNKLTNGPMSEYITGDDGQESDVSQNESRYLRDMILLHTFVLEQLSAFHKWVLIKKLGCFEDYTRNVIHPYKWLAGWTFVIGTNLFFVYWVFAWGIQDGDAMLQAWGSNYAIGLLQDVFMVNVAKTMLFYFVALQVILPRLRTMHAYLTVLVTEQSKRSATLTNNSAASQKQQFGGTKNEIRKRLPQDAFRIVQVSSPAVRVAQLLTVAREEQISHFKPIGAHGTSVSDVLSHLDDFDVQCCNARVKTRGQIFRFGILGVFILLIPILLALGGEEIADIVLDMVMPSASSAFLLVNYLLSSIPYGNIAIVVIYIVVIIVLFWRVVLLPVAKSRLLEHQIEQRYDLIQQYRNSRSLEQLELQKKQAIILHKNNPVRQWIAWACGASYSTPVRTENSDAVESNRQPWWWWILGGNNVPATTSSTRWQLIFLYQLVYYLHPASWSKKDVRIAKQRDIWKLYNLPYECSPIVLSTSTYGERSDSDALRRKSSILLLEYIARQASASSASPIKNVYSSREKLPRQLTLLAEEGQELSKEEQWKFPAQITSLLYVPTTGASLASFLSKDAFVATETPMVVINAQTQAALNIRMGKEIDAWVLAYRRQSALPRRRAAYKLLFKSPIRQYLQRYTPSMDETEMLIRILISYLQVEYLQTGTQKLQSSISCPDYGPLARRKIMKAIQSIAEEHPEIVVSAETVTLLQVSVLMHVLVGLLSSGLILPGGSLIQSQEHMYEVMDSLHQVALGEAAASFRMSYDDGEALRPNKSRIALEIFVAWFKTLCQSPSFTFRKSQKDLILTPTKSMATAAATATSKISSLPRGDLKHKSSWGWAQFDLRRLMSFSQAKSPSLYSIHSNSDNFIVVPGDGSNNDAIYETTETNCNTTHSEHNNDQRVDKKATNLIKKKFEFHGATLDTFFAVSASDDQLRSSGGIASSPMSFEQVRTPRDANVYFQCEEVVTDDRNVKVTTVESNANAASLQYSSNGQANWFSDVIVDPWIIFWSPPATPTYAKSKSK
jgi:hypothetical protein